ncbi:MAG: hypothetical protein EHM24_25250, partial [Acidobacteria bacterium]
MNHSFDLVVRNGLVVAGSSTGRYDVAAAGGRIAAIGAGLGPGAQEIDASGKLVLPGGIDSHCHVEEESSAGLTTADDFNSATLAAAGEAFVRHGHNLGLAVSWLLHQLVARFLARFGSAELCRQYLPLLASGRITGCFAVSEP